MSAQSVDVWIQNALLHVNYCSATTEQCSVCPRLLFSFDFTQGSAPQHGGRPSPIAGSVPSPVAATMILSGFAVELRLGTSSKEYYIGQLVSSQALVFLQANVRTNLTLGLDLDHYELREIEKLRESKDLQFIVNFAFTSEVQGNPQTKASSGFHLRFKIPKSDWVENILPAVGYKEVALLEIPKLPDSEFEDIANHINAAWKQHSMGEYGNVFTECRKALETLTGKMKAKGFEKEITDNEGKKKKVPDWEKLLGSSELGDILGTVNQKILGFVAPGAHAGKAINKEEADFGLMITHSLLNIAIHKLTQP